LKYREISNIQNAVNELVRNEFALCVGTSNTQVELPILIELLQLLNTEQLLQVLTTLNAISFKIMKEFCG
jgi:hypothetical protein